MLHPQTGWTSPAAPTTATKQEEIADDKLDSEGEVSGNMNESPGMRRSKRETKLSSKMKESLEYLTRANVATSEEIFILKMFYEAM
jgi:hypothetical protein